MTLFGDKVFFFFLAACAMLYVGSSSRTCALCIGTHSLNHWATREIPEKDVFAAVIKDLKIRSFWITWVELKSKDE